MIRAGLLALVLLAVGPACKRHGQPPTPAGTRFTASWGGYPGTTTHIDVGIDSTVEKRVTVHMDGEPPLRFALSILTGQFDFIYRDGSRARRQVAKRIDAELLDAAPDHVTFACERDASGPTEAKPTALFMACSFTCEGCSPPASAALSVYGDGTVADVGPRGGPDTIDVSP